MATFSMVCDLIDYGNEFTSLRLHDFTSHSNGCTIDPVSIQSANVNSISFQISDNTDI